MPRRLFDARDAQTHKVSPPRPHTFNHEVGVYVFEIVDIVGVRCSILNADNMSTTYDQAWIVRESECLGSPSSHACLRAFVHEGRVGQAGRNFFAATVGYTIEA